jgi:hypothetical protein
VAAVSARDGKGPCPDCGVEVGVYHHPECDVPRCVVCGGQRLMCMMLDQHPAEVPVRWTGTWPGVLECREFGLYVKQGVLPWTKTTADDPDRTEDLNTLAEMGAKGELKWTGERWVKP